MKFIVTGSEGFIGKALTQFLRNLGHSVIGYDRKTGREAEDIVHTLCADNIDGVFHLAAQTSVWNSDTEQICRDNIATFIKVCDTCSKYGVKLVYASSSTAYQDNTTSMYGLSKRFCEQYAAIYNRSATGIRFHNVYGKEPRQGTLLAHCLSDKPITLYNNGMNVRHFTYIGDIVEAAYYAMFSDQRILNAYNPEQTTVLEFVDFVRKYRAVDYECVSKSRDFDCIEQSVDNWIFNVPLQYTSVADGIMKVFS